MKQYKSIAYFIGALLVLIIGACTKMDDYKDKYMQGGAIIYPGKMDGVKIFSGKNRVKITGLFTSDLSIVKYRVFWNSRQDSIEMTVKRTSGVDTAKVTISNLPEGAMSFEIRTYDALGHTSVPVDTVANVYGALYQGSCTNRGIANIGILTNGSASITWADVNANSGIINMEIKYTDNSNKAHDTLITSVPTGLTTLLPNFKASNAISYRTSYLPNPTAIDTFYVASVVQTFNPYAGTYQSIGVFHHPVNGDRSINETKVLSRITDQIVQCNLGDLGSSGYFMQLKVNADLTVTITPAGATPNIDQHWGANYYDPVTKSFHLFYSYNTSAPRKVEETITLQ